MVLLPCLAVFIASISVTTGIALHAAARCGHCKKLEPEWAKEFPPPPVAKEELKKKKTKKAKKDEL